MIAISMAILVTLASMYLAGAIANRRGRSVRVWVWIAVLAGPFAPALLLLLPPPQSQNSRRAG
jgi:hypothetical protein